MVTHKPSAIWANANGIFLRQRHFTVITSSFHQIYLFQRMQFSQWDNPWIQTMCAKVKEGKHEVNNEQRLQTEC